VLDAAIILRGNCSPPTAVWLEKVILTGTTNDTVSRNIKKNAAVKYTIRAMSALAGFTSKHCRRKLFKSYRIKLEYYL
jgi:hypothetical protein